LYFYAHAIFTQFCQLNNTWCFCVPECFSTFRVESDITGYKEQKFTVFTGLEVPGMSSGCVEIAPCCESHSVNDSNLVSRIFLS
jgi:hypothetical protein